MCSFVCDISVHVMFHHSRDHENSVGLHVYNCSLCKVLILLQLQVSVCDVDSLQVDSSHRLWDDFVFNDTSHCHSRCGGPQSDNNAVKKAGATGKKQKIGVC